MRKPIRNLLMTAMPGFVLDPPGTGIGYHNIIPGYAAEDHLLTLTISSVVGAPTAASVKMLFEGVLGTMSVGPGNVFDNNPGYFTLPASKYEAADTYSDPLADHTLAAPKTFQWLIKGGFAFRLGLQQSFTGGTTPHFLMSADIVSRY